MKRRIAIVVFVIVSLTIPGILLVIQGSRVDFSNLSTDDLADNGFYAYVLPSDVVTRMRWTQTIWMNSNFDEHCFQEDTIARPNPVHISYHDGTQHALFSVEIVPTYVYWDSNQEIDRIPLELDWIPSGSGAYYSLDSGYIILKLTDSRGLSVVVQARGLDISQVTELIAQLQYAGPDASSVGNPWENICK